MGLIEEDQLVVDHDAGIRGIDVVATGSPGHEAGTGRSAVADPEPEGSAGVWCREEDQLIRGTEKLSVCVSQLMSSKGGAVSGEDSNTGEVVEGTTGKGCAKSELLVVCSECPSAVGESHDTGTLTKTRRDARKSEQYERCCDGFEAESGHRETRTLVDYNSGIESD